MASGIIWASKSPCISLHSTVFTTRGREGTSIKLKEERWGCREHAIRSTPCTQTANTGPPLDAPGLTGAGVLRPSCLLWVTKGRFPSPVASLVGKRPASFLWFLPHVPATLALLPSVLRFSFLAQMSWNLLHAWESQLTFPPSSFAFVFLFLWEIEKERNGSQKEEKMRNNIFECSILLPKC